MGWGNNASVLLINNMLEKKIKSAKSLEEKQKFKVTEFKKLKLPISYTYEGIDIEIVGIREGRKGVLEIYPKASIGGVSKQLGTPYQFMNPPIKVKDGTKRKEKDPEGKEIEVDNHKVDLLGAIKEFVGQVVVTQ